MKTLNDFLQTTLADIDEALALAVVDMDTRQLLGVATKSTTLGQANLEAFAVAAVEMVRGKHVRAIETLLSNHLGETIANSISDLCINAFNSRHFLEVLPDKQNLLVALSTNKEINIAMGLAVLRKSLRSIQEHCP